MRKEKEIYKIDHKITMIRRESLPDVTIAGYMKNKVSDQLYNNASACITSREHVHELDVNAKVIPCRMWKGECLLCERVLITNNLDNIRCDGGGDGSDVWCHHSLRGLRARGLFRLDREIHNLAEYISNAQRWVEWLTSLGNGSSSTFSSFAFESIYE